MSTSGLLESFQEITIEKPSEKIINQIRQLISSGQLQPGDRIPSERKLVERLGVSRSHIREALQKLEFYGILKTHPQSGTVVAGMGITAAEGFFTDVIKLDNSDFASLVETRVILETQAARLAATRRSPENIVAIRAALDAYRQKIESGGQAMEEDLHFHITIAEASQNTVLKSLMLIITPDIVSSFIKLDICKGDHFFKVLDEHELILQHITNQEPELAAQAMRKHLSDVLDYSRTVRDNGNINNK